MRRKYKQKKASFSHVNFKDLSLNHYTWITARGNATPLLVLFTKMAIYRDLIDQWNGLKRKKKTPIHATKLEETKWIQNQILIIKKQRITGYIHIYIYIGTRLLSTNLTCDQHKRGEIITYRWENWWREWPVPVALNNSFLWCLHVQHSLL